MDSYTSFLRLHCLLSYIYTNIYVTNPQLLDIVPYFPDSSWYTVGLPSILSCFRMPPGELTVANISCKSLCLRARRMLPTLRSESELKLPGHKKKAQAQSQGLKEIRLSHWNDSQLKKGKKTWPGNCVFPSQLHQNWGTKNYRQAE